MRLIAPAATTLVVRGVTQSATLKTNPRESMSCRCGPDKPWSVPDQCMNLERPWKVRYGTLLLLLFLTPSEGSALSSWATGAFRL